MVSTPWWFISETSNEGSDMLREKYSSDEKIITLNQFLTWNRQIIGTCNNIRGWQSVCKGPPGGEYQKPGLIHAPTGTAKYYATATPPAPTATGTTSSCGKYHTAESGDTYNGIIFR